MSRRDTIANNKCKPGDCARRHAARHAGQRGRHSPSAGITVSAAYCFFVVAALVGRSRQPPDRRPPNTQLGNRRSPILKHAPGLSFLSGGAVWHAAHAGIDMSTRPKRPLYHAAVPHGNSPGSQFGRSQARVWRYITTVTHIF